MTVDGMVRIAGVQMTPRFADVAGNLALHQRYVQEAATLGARLIVFPECSLTGYCFNGLEEMRAVAQPVPGPATEEMAAWCRATHVTIVAGLLEIAGGSIYNALALIGPGGLIGSYRKVHIPFLGADRYTTPGDRPFRVYEAAGCRVGINICYDIAFPESARVLALEGADLIVLSTNWPPGSEEMAAHAVNMRALENRVYYIAVNRVGEERGFRFIGASRIADVDGRDLATAGASEETILYADIDPRRAREKRIVRVPDAHVIDRWKDRRPEMYGTITRPRTGR